MLQVSTNSAFEGVERSISGRSSSAFGGVLITNKEIDFETSKEINNLFMRFDCCPSFEKTLTYSKKKNRIILHKIKLISRNQFRSALNGILMQQKI